MRMVHILMKNSKHLSILQSWKGMLRSILNNKGELMVKVHFTKHLLDCALKKISLAEMLL